jgi:sigma-B regulation protein RsbU (phosphoserine phosphatase)
MWGRRLVTRARVLVVDDEPSMLHAAKRVLSGQYDVAVARGPREALELLPTFKPDLGILDIRMPDMDGFELMGRLKALRPDLDLIVMTGSVTEADAKLIRAIREKAFYFIQKPFDREVLLTLVGRCLELRRLTEENRRHVARLEGELKEARAFQKSLLPAGEGRIEEMRIQACCVPCNELGGDFFDYAPAGKGRATVLVADVSGHGAAAAMLTGIVKAAFHSANAEEYEPAAVIGRIASGMRTMADNMMVTAICARITPATSRTEGIIEFVNAGHPPGVLWNAPGASGRTDADAPSLLKSNGPLISPAFPRVTWKSRTLPIARGARLLLYSDGIVEAQGEDEEFGLTRLLDLCRERGPAAITPAGILEGLAVFAAGRPAADDMTLLLSDIGVD